MSSGGPSRQALLTRSRRIVRCPKAYKDYLPSSATPVVQISRITSRPPAPVVPHHNSPDPPGPELPEAPPDHSPTYIDTEPNDMGVYRSYTSWPILDPEDSIGLAEVCDSAEFATGGSVPPSSSPHNSTLLNAPFANITVHRLMKFWFGEGTVKSINELDRLVNEILLQDDFSQDDLRGFNAARELQRLDKHNDIQDITPGWTESSVKIRLPSDHVGKKGEIQSAEYETPVVFYRKLVDVLKEAFQDPTSQAFHFTPFKHFWQAFKDAQPVRFYGELYTADAMLEEHEKLMSSVREPGCSLERVLASIMVWSDSTRLTNFGSASLWPIYIFFGNQSKYLRAKPQSCAAHHLAYIPSVCFSTLPKH
jgi:Plavaka transposase